MANPHALITLHCTQFSTGFLSTVRISLILNAKALLEGHASGTSSHRFPKLNPKLNIWSVRIKIIKTLIDKIKPPARTTATLDMIVDT
ncbi:unnamed protein product [Leuciscus chuanchicus]